MKKIKIPEDKRRIIKFQDLTTGQWISAIVIENTSESENN